jgi:hypothetical protein
LFISFECQLILLYIRADRVLEGWSDLLTASTNIYNSLSSAFKPAYYQTVHHAVLASANLGNLYITAGNNNMRASQARVSANDLADQAAELFDKDYELETAYHTLLDGMYKAFDKVSRESKVFIRKMGSVS